MTPVVMRHEAAAPVRACRFCGCTEERACSGGCSWVGTNVCSACAFSETGVALHDCALVIVVGARYFSGFAGRGRIRTAWSIAGALLFLPGGGREIRKVWHRLKARRRPPPFHIRAVDLDHAEAPAE